MLSISTSSTHSQLSLLVVDTQKRDGVDMATMTKTQQKRALTDILKKAKKIWLVNTTSSRPPTLSFSDVEAIDKIVRRALKRLG